MSVSLVFSKAAYFLFIGILLFNLFQKKYAKRGEQKRFATLYLGFAVLGVFLAAGAVLYSEQILGTKLNDFLILPATAVIALFVLSKRDKTLPFRFHCGKCGAKLTMERALCVDSNLCADCDKL